MHIFNAIYLEKLFQISFNSLHVLVKCLLTDPWHAAPSMGTLCPAASGIRASATAPRFPGLCSLAARISAALSLSYVEYFTFSGSGLIAVAFLSCRVGSWNRAGS